MSIDNDIQGAFFYGFTNQINPSNAGEAKYTGAAGEIPGESEKAPGQKEQDTRVGKMIGAACAMRP